MASEVDICNLAVGHLGDDASISSINPPEGSAQAEHCARYYPIARDTLLEAHNWGFATKRAAMAQLSNPPSSWAYAYALPADCLKVQGIYPSDALNDFTTKQPYTREVGANGEAVIYTNQASAVVRYTVYITDPGAFSPLFVTCLSWLLASQLAGPILKGKTGVAVSKACLEEFYRWVARATYSDSNQQQTDNTHNVQWMTDR